MSEQPDIPEGLEFDLADRLRKSLRHSGFSSQQMGEYLEVSRHTVSNWLNGHTRPRPAELKMWAMRVGVPYTWLIGKDDPRASSADIRTGISGQVPPPTTAEIKALMKRIPLTRPAAAKADMRS